MSSFDGRTMEFNFGEANSDNLRDTVKRMAEFIAYFEMVESRTHEWQLSIEENIMHHQSAIRDQLLEMRETIADFSALMTEAGVARWRLSAEAALQQGSEHLQLLDKTCQNYIDKLLEHHDYYETLAKKSLDRLDRASAYTIKNISDAVGTFRLSDFQKLAEESITVIETTSNHAISQMDKTSRRIHWKHMLLSLTVAVVTTLTIGLYLNNEVPWESHQRAATERHYGAALMNAWPSLSENERQKIIQHSNKDLA